MNVLDSELVAGAMRKTERTEALIFEAARRLVSDHGLWSRVSIEALAQKAGIVRSTIFNRFPNGKDTIYRSLVANMANKLTEEIGQLEPSKQSMTRGVQMVVSWLTTNPWILQNLATNEADSFLVTPWAVRDALTAAIDLGYSRRSKDQMRAGALAMVLLPHVLNVDPTVALPDAVRAVVGYIELAELGPDSGTTLPDA